MVRRDAATAAPARRSLRAIGGRVSDRIPVLIVGGGPVGLALAMDLGWRGIGCTLVERRDGAVDFPKMNMVSSRSMEFCRRWGINDAVKAAGWSEDLPLNIVFLTAMTGHELARFDYPGYRARGALADTPEGSRRCPQTLFDPILRERARAQNSVTLRHRTALSDFSQDGDGVRATLVDLETGRDETVEADFLVGCDGATSMVRERLGIEMDGDAVLTHNMNVFFVADELPGWQAHGQCWAHWLIGPGGQWGNIVAVDGKRQWRLSMTGFAADATLDPEQAASHVRHAVGCDFAFEVKAVMPWVRRRQVARHYRSGRAFIAGDAAHLLSPTGGFGMNTGIGDAIDLGWKLAAVIEGWAGPALLDSYQAERRPIGTLNVNEAARNFGLLAALAEATGADVAADTPQGATIRARLGATIRDGGYNQEYEAEGLILGYHYDGSPIIAGEDGAAPPLAVSQYEPGTRPGARAPHAWLEDGRRSTLDLFGRGFVLLRLGAAPPSDTAIRDAAMARGVPLAVHDIDDPAIHALYEKRLVLVRPDGHVAWRGDAPPADGAELIALVCGANAANEGGKP
jgi:2-polyprenyl-6-methoxyphenol hydroxylase-like FAD-dependent oxidoreductase